MSLSASLRKTYACALQASARLNRPRLAAMLMMPAFRTVKPAKSADARTVVILPKEGFTEDMMAALADADGVRVVALPRIVVKLLAAPFLPYFIDDNNYASCGAEYDEAKLRYRRFWVAVLTLLRRFKRIDAVISGNFSYAAERALASAMEDIGLSFIALHKENLKTPGRVEFFERVYRERRGPFTGRKILVYNQVERDLQIRAGVAAPERIDITGMPRLDRLHAWRRAHAGSAQANRILFFVFSPATGMPRIARKGETPGAVRYEDEEEGDGDISLRALCDQTCQAVLEVAQKNPDIEIVVKSKGRRRDLDETARLFGFRSEAELPPNIRIVHGGDVLPLIAQASVVCGFNSTALLEAVAAGKSIVMPWFAEAQMPEVLLYVMDLREVGIAASSPQSLADALVRVARNPRPVPAQLDTAAQDALRYWTGNADGNATERAREAILREVSA